MNTNTFVYVTYIATTPELVWQAFTDTEITPRWFRLATSATTPLQLVSDWRAGSQWQRRRMDGAQTVDIAGEVLESARARRLVITWGRPGDGAGSEKTSRISVDIEPYCEGLVKVTFQHDRLDAEMHRIVSGGWPQALSNLKSFLETGHSLPARPVLAKPQPEASR